MWERHGSEWEWWESVGRRTSVPQWDKQKLHGKKARGAIRRVEGRSGRTLR